MQLYVLRIQRRFWQHLLEQAWRERSVIWLSGVRRVGKTCLCQSLPHVEYLDCELPRVRRMMEEPEGFLDGFGNQSIVLDEIHRLQNPSELLKIAADHYPSLRVIATDHRSSGLPGSSGTRWPDPSGSKRKNREMGWSIVFSKDRVYSCGQPRDKTE